MAEVAVECAPKYTPYDGVQTEYSDNYRWKNDHQETAQTTRNMYRGVNDAAVQGLNPHDKNELRRPTQHPPWETPMPAETCRSSQRDPTKFHSMMYPSVFRETTVRKDDRGKYHDLYKDLSVKPYGRKLLYDTTHPDKMYSSQWSSELADIPGCYSFPAPTGLAPEIPWRRDLQWKAEGEVGEWATPLWKDWTKHAMCPPYDGHDDQVEYSKYKTQGPWNNAWRQ